MEGLEKFREAFEDYADNYVIIGGVACNITMSGSSVRPRATHDIDMIIIVERMSPQFGDRFWQFVREAGYKAEMSRPKEGESPRYELYRFVDGRPEYPEMIELLSRRLDFWKRSDAVVEPFPMGEEVSSLSAIILDDDYYDFTIEHSRITDGIRHADPLALIALKTRAYLNLLRDKTNGNHVNSRDIRKHRTDVLKNVVLVIESGIEAPLSIVEGVREFVDSIRDNWDVLGNSIAQSLNQRESFVERLLELLDNLFIVRL